MADKYHHGNLREALIEAGIKLVNEQGIQHFSLRKVAAQCGVSHAAPYSHFASKEELMEAMQAYVIQQFMQELHASQQQYQHSRDKRRILQLGKAYVQFFIQHPQYYAFLFYRSNLEMNLEMENMQEACFEPLLLLKQILAEVFGDSGIPSEKLQDMLITLWSTVHGLAGIATMPQVRYDKNWEDKIEDIIWNE